MMLRIIHGKLNPGTWNCIEQAYKDVIAKAGKISGLRGRWRARRRRSRCRIYVEPVRQKSRAAMLAESVAVVSKPAADGGRFETQPDLKRSDAAQQPAARRSD